MSSARITKGLKGTGTAADLRTGDVIVVTLPRTFARAKATVTVLTFSGTTEVLVTATTADGKHVTDSYAATERVTVLPSL